MTKTKKNPGQVRVLVLRVGAQSSNSAPDSKMVLLFTAEDSRLFHLLQGKLTVFDKMAFNPIS